MAASIPKTVADFETTLDQQAFAGDTTLELSSIVDTDGNNLAAGLYAFTLSGDEETYKEFCLGTLSSTTVSGIFSVSDQNAVTSGLQKYHRRGALVSVTDWVAIGRLTAAARGEAGYDGSSPLFYDASPAGLSGTDIPDVNYVLSVVNGGPVSFQQQVLTVQVAGENLTVQDHVFFQESDARWYKVDADVLASYSGVKRGIALGTQTTGNTLSVAVSGLVGGFTGLTLGQPYYASSTAGAIVTPGTNGFIGVAFSTTQLIVDQYIKDIPTGDQKAALAGSQGIPTAANAYLTEDNASAAGIDQSQLTANSTQIFGTASTTGLQNRLAQSFIPTKTKVRGVTLDKDADTGTFTGTVTIALQADTAGSPSGVNLASVTITNALWLGMPAGVFTAMFSAEYDSLTVGSLYWIVATTSTADTVNHPNLGANSVGGYANGTAKYFNATDSWVLIPTVDLYFSTLEGINSQVVLSDSAGQVPNPFLSTFSQKVNGMLAATYDKLYYNMYLPFTLWTGVSASATDTAFQNWNRSSSSIEVGPMGAYLKLTSTNALYISLEAPFYNADGTTIEWNDTQELSMDFWAAIITPDDEVNMGFGTSSNSYTQDSTGNAIFAGFVFDGSLLYIKTASGAAQTLTQITGYTLTTFHNYRIALDLGADTVSFYVDGTLVGTIITTIATSASPLFLGFGRQDDATVTITAPNVSIEMNP